MSAPLIKVDRGQWEFLKAIRDALVEDVGFLRTRLENAERDIESLKFEIAEFEDEVLSMNTDNSVRSDEPPKAAVREQSLPSRSQLSTALPLWACWLILGLCTGALVFGVFIARFFR